MGGPAIATADPSGVTPAAEWKGRPEPQGRSPILHRLPSSGWPRHHDLVARVACLERTPVFFALPDSALLALARRLRRLAVAAGEMIVFQGEPGDTIFLIERGRCRKVVETPAGAVTVGVLAESDFFGEGACVLERPQQASVYAQTDCTLLALDRVSLHSVITPDSALLDELGRVAEQRSAACSEAAKPVTETTSPDGATFVVYGPRGGTGATLLSLNLAGTLARRHPRQVLLLDLDLPFAHSALLAGLVPTTCLARLGSVPADTLEEVLLGAVLYHSGGPMILAGALRPEEADEVTPELVTRAIGALRKTFRYIVVDASANLAEPVLTALDLARKVVVVAGPDISALKSAADAIEVLSELGIPRAALTVVLNHRSPKPAAGRSAVERLLKRPVDVEVGFDGARPYQAALKGEILSLTSPRSEIARGVEALADLLEKPARKRQPDTAPALSAAERR